MTAKPTPPSDAELPCARCEGGTFPKDTSDDGGPTCFRCYGSGCDPATSAASMPDGVEAEEKVVKFLFDEYRFLQPDEERTKDLIRAAYRYGRQAAAATPAAPKADPAKMRSAKYWYVQEVWAGRSPQQYLDVITAIQQDAIASVTPAPAADAGLREALVAVLPMAENYLDMQMINPSRDKDIRFARAALSATPPEPQPATRRTAEELMRDIHKMEDAGQCTNGDIYKVIQSALDAERAAAVPDGWQLVPKKATDEMIHKGADMFNDIGGQGWGFSISWWSLMLAASPQPPVGEG